MEREAAEPVENWLAAIEFDRQRKMRPVADDDVGAGVDRAMRDLAHVSEDFLVQPPMKRGDNGISLPAQRLDIFVEAFQIGGIRPGHDCWRDTGTIGRGAAA